jgi:dihydroorotase
MGLPGGTLAPGSPADVTLIDLEREVTVDSGTFRSKSVNTPFEGWTLRGGPLLTICGGTVHRFD